MPDRKPTSKYTAEMEARIREFGSMNQALSEDLAREFGNVTPASVRAKAVRMGLPYERKQPTTKNGAPVERKEAIVAELESIVEASLEGLEKAPKPVLQRLRDFARG